MQPAPCVPHQPSGHPTLPVLTPHILVLCAAGARGLMAATAQGLPPGPRRLARLAAHLGAPGGWGPATACWAPAAGGGGPAVRVGIFGAGGHARRAHAPNLRALPGVEVVAIADANTELAEALAADFCPSARIFADGHEMLEAMELDALFSVVPAFARAAGVEAAAAARGIHLFSEKPQTLDMVLVAPRHPTPRPAPTLTTPLTSGARRRPMPSPTR